jgi:hypothetical protein
MELATLGRFTLWRALGLMGVKRYLFTLLCHRTGGLRSRGATQGTSFLSCLPLRPKAVDLPCVHIQSVS